MKRKKRLIEAVLLVVLFVASVSFFSYLTNKDNNNMTADMGTPTLPQLSFSYNGYNLNILAGYTKEMDMKSMRDTVTPVMNNRMTLLIADYGNEITSVEYHVYTLDGTTQLVSETIDSPAQNTVLEFTDKGILDEERNLRLDVTLESGKLIHYYTRIMNAEYSKILDNLDYIDLFFQTEMGKDTEESFSIGDDLEPNVMVDNYSYQHVDITSDKSYVSWGELNPEVVGGVRYQIKELNDVYTSVLMNYQVRCKGEENPSDIYDVSEFFRVRTIEGHTYLLDYDRTMEQKLSYNDTVLDNKGILLGIVDSEPNYDVNSSGTIVNFVQAGELWNYDKKQDKLSLLFSFSDGESTDTRNLTTGHKIDILNTDKDGNTTFIVYGYMNRGEHEGEVGAGIYFFDKAKNTIEEKAFVGSNLSAERAIEQLSSMIYFNVEDQAVYAVVDGNVYRYSVFFETTDPVLENLQESRYAVSSNVRWVAYKGDVENSMTILDFATMEERVVSVNEDETICPLGFLGDDVVYGIARNKDIVKADGEESFVPMYKILIESPEGAKLKEYEEQGIFVESADFNEKMATLNRVAVHGNDYTTIAPDYIMNNEEKRNSNITPEVYYGDIKFTQIRLTFEDGISDMEPKILKPKHVLYESSVSLPFGMKSDDNMKEEYFVYGLGRLKGVYKQQGQAIRCADKYNGVVVSSNQNYIWESGNRDLKYYYNDEDFVSRICRKLRAGKTPEEVISEMNNGRVFDLTGCKAEELLYVINNRGPVIGMLSPAEYAVLIGYGDGTVTYIAVGDKKENDKEVDKTMTELDVMTNSFGNVYYGF